MQWKNITYTSEIFGFLEKTLGTPNASKMVLGGPAAPKLIFGD